MKALRLEWLYLEVELRRKKRLETKESIMLRRKSLAILVIMATMAWTTKGFAWSELGHRLSFEKAIESLSDPLKDFYEDREDALMEQIRNPVLVGPRIVFEVDRLEPFPFQDIPTSRSRAARKYGEGELDEVGDVAWRFQDRYQELVEAFKAVDVAAIETRSIELAYYVDEIHQPLNLSKNGDGHTIDQAGLRERFDSRLLEVYGDELDVEETTAIYLDRPDEYVSSMLRRSYVWVDNIVLSDYLARLGVSSYDRFYYEGLWLRTESIINRLLSDSAKDVASYWYTAWTEAGRPDLPKR